MTALNNSKYQYCDSSKWAAVAAYPGAGSVAAGILCTNTANSPAVGSERVFVSTAGGTTAGVAPTFTTTKGAITEDQTTGIYWQECTGQPGVNGDITNSPVWGATLTVVLGQIIYHAGTASLQIANSSFTTASTTPTFSATAGVTSTGQDVGKWTSLGLASAFGAFAAPHARILNADAATWQTVVPATIYVGSGHAETAAAALTLLGGSGTTSSPNKYLCVSNASAPPTACTTGATVSTTGANAIIIENYGYYYGISFLSGSSTNAAALSLGDSALSSLWFESCGFTLNNTGTSQIRIAEQGVQSPNITTLLNCTFVFGTTSQFIQMHAGIANIIGGSIALTGSVPTTLFEPGSSSRPVPNCIVRDCDLSKVTTTLFNIATQETAGYFIFENCKLGAGVAMTTGTFTGNGGVIFKMHNCDSGSKNYRFYEGSYLGTIQQETTIVDSTHPATDGVTPISWNIATTANTSFGQPYVSPEIVAYNALTTGSHTATIKINSNIALTNALIWMELEYLGNASFPIGSIVSSRAADAVATPTTYTSDSDTWGGSETHQQYMQVTFSPAMAGAIKARIYVADPSVTIYVNPLIIVS